MKAWQIQRHGGPEVLQWVDKPTPLLKPNEVRLQVEAVGLNHLDVWVRKGVPGHPFPLPLTPGCDIAGKVLEIGSGVKESLMQDGIDVGSSVLVNPGVSCGHCVACLSGFDPLCRSYGILGETQDGGCAEQVVVPGTNLISLPASLSPTDAACLPIPFLTAWTMLIRKAELKPGETILIQAGGSAVSVAAIQIAKLLGATVITTVGSDEKIQKAKELGADFVIPYRKTPFREELKKIMKSLSTSPLPKKGCDVVMDHVGADTFQDSMKSLAWGGRLVTCGATSGGEVQIDLKAVFFKNLSILGSTMGSKADLIRIVDLVTQGKLKPVLGGTYPLLELPQALRLLEQRQVFGKVVLRPFHSAAQA